MKKSNVNLIIKNQLCSGCGTCNLACPRSAIKMVFSPIGRLMPIVNETECTNCGICVDVCPGVDMSGKFTNSIDTTLMGNTLANYLAKSNNEVIFANAQSGGCVTETLSYLFDNDLINAALIVTQNKQQATFCVVTTTDDLIHCQSSQYTPVDLVSGLAYLNDYNHVAIVGLPCHIEGIIKLRELFPSRYKNIDYLLGLVCAGTLSQTIFDVVKNIGENKIGKINDNDIISWRLKKYSDYSNSHIAVINPGGSIRMLNKNIRHAAKSYLTPPRCHLCFDKMNLFADIVFGDCWGISGSDTQNGANVIIVRTECGNKIVSEMIQQNRLYTRICPFEEIQKGQLLAGKKELTQKMIQVYKDMGYLIPKWSVKFESKSEISIDNSCKKAMIDYLDLDSKERHDIVTQVSAKIKRKMFIWRVNSFCRRLKRRFGFS